MPIQVVDSPDPRNIAAKIATLKAQGVKAVILYISPIWLAGDKTAKKPSIDAILAAGVDVGFVCGYTLLLATSANIWSAALYDNLNFNFIRDITPIATIVRGLGVMDVNPSFPARTVAEFIAYARANPGQINMGSAGIGTPQHLYGELFKMLTGVNMLHVPYRGSPQALTGLFAGEIQVLFDTLSTSIEHIKAGRLRALAVTSAARSDPLPDVPTVGEFVPGYEATSWLGLGAPRNTPAEIVDILNKEINAGLVDPQLKARIEGVGYSGFASSVSEFTLFIAEDTEKWGKVIQTANIKAN
jgi:tripartite-type tricarboxylate transporter receptor subunit TctC